MRVVAYTRVSSKGQADGDGPKRQRLEIRKFCTKVGFKLISRSPERFDFFEPISGTKEAAHRAVFSEMLAFIVANPTITGIVVERMDRLARDLIVSELLLMECQKIGVSVFTADQDSPCNLADSSTDPMRHFIRQVMGAAAQLDKSLTVRKLAVARQRIRARDGKCEGQKLYGELRGEPEVLLAMRAFRDQGFSLRAITKQLNMGELHPRRGKRWHPWSVKRILDRAA